jgi:hypothetical protein
MHVGCRNTRCFLPEALAKLHPRISWSNQEDLLLAPKRRDAEQEATHICRFMGSFVAINLCLGLGERRYTYPLFPSPLAPYSPSYAPGATRSFASRVIDIYLPRQRYVISLHAVSEGSALGKNTCRISPGSRTTNLRGSAILVK